VLATDSQVTGAARGMTDPAQKLHPLGDHAAWGGSGSRAVLLDLEKVFASSSAAILEGDDVGRELQEHLSDEDVEEVRGLVERWAEAERAALDGLLDGSSKSSWARPS
jgi:hypothetical protein